MKIATWNINSVRTRIGLLQDYLREVSPEFMCLQEIKCMNQDFPFAEIEQAGYKAYVSGQKAYNGTAILTKSELSEVLTALPDSAEAEGLAAGENPQARFTAGLTKYGFYIISVYVPNGNPPLKQPESKEKLVYKLKWFDCLHKYLKGLKEAEKPFIICGDFNVIIEDTDVYNPDNYRTNALMLPEVRTKLDEIAKDLDLLNTFKTLHKGETHLYSFWDYTMRCWEKNHGMLIDDIFMCGFKESALLNALIDKDMRAKEKPSDHVPLQIEITDLKKI